MIVKNVDYMYEYYTHKAWNGVSIISAFHCKLLQVKLQIEFLLRPGIYIIVKNVHVVAYYILIVKIYYY